MVSSSVSLAATPSSRSEKSGYVEELARRTLSDRRQCPYAFYFRDISCQYQGGVLTLKGRLPTFHLKQVLQSMLKNLEGIERIDNQVDVLCANGLSSEPHFSVHRHHASSLSGDSR